MFGTLVGWRAYATARGYGSATGLSDDTLATAALTRASDYIQYSYINLFIGGPDSTKPEVEPATYEAALLELATPGLFSGSYTPDQRKVLTGVEGISWTPVTSKTGRPEGADSMPRSVKVESMLQKYMPGKYAFGITALGGDYV